MRWFTLLSATSNIETHLEIIENALITLEGHGQPVLDLDLYLEEWLHLDPVSNPRP